MGGERERGGEPKRGTFINDIERVMVTFIVVTYVDSCMIYIIINLFDIVVVV